MQNMTRQILLYGGVLLLLTNSALAGDKFTPDSQPSGWISVPDVSFFDVSSGTETFYQLGYFKDTWSGNVHALDINSTARIQTTGPWDELDPTLAAAAPLLDAKDYNTDRKIATFGHPFRWASLTSDQQKKLGKEAMVNYIRGDRSNEEPDGESYREREFVLGDILHSNIVWWDHGASKSLYVGSNDGMLHAFDAATGAENFAYIPSMLIPTLKELAKKPYIHRHFVDGPISIANVDISGTQKTILVGGLGAGLTGLYALDITTPTAADESAVASKALWEILSTVDPFKDNVGHIYGTPRFARLSDGTAAVIFSNGYISRKGNAILYVVNANTGALIKSFDTGTADGKKPNGLSSPALYDVDGDAVPEYAYAGDMDGQMWKFDLVNDTSTVVWTTSPLQPITTAPIVRPHPLGGQMVAFATGRLLTTGDPLDVSVHYAYGIWDGAPVTNVQLVTQTFTDTDFEDQPVRTVTSNIPNWTAGNHKGWKIALQPGERVVGEEPIYNNGRYYFLSTNPTVEGGENWINELVLNTGGSPLGPIFDLNEDGLFNASDLADNGGIPVAKYLGSGIFSQPRLVVGEGLTTTLYAFHPDLPIIDGVPTDPDDPGVSTGHFDFDIFYYGPDSTTTEPVPTELTDTTTICKKTNDVAKRLDSIDNLCKDDPVIADGYIYLTDYVTGSICKDDNDLNKVEYWQTLTCNTVDYVEFTSADYKKIKHVHEYDDKYNVTGVNMLNASDSAFNLINALPNGAKQFKILVMNQYLNPAVHLSVGGADYESVQTYGNLATQTNPETLLAGLPIYTRDTIGTFIYNLPVTAFKNKDWWGDGLGVRAGLIPTQTGCVNSVNAEGVQDQPGKQGERFNGSFAIQLIRHDTPAEALEFNGPDVTYGWRVKMGVFTDWVLAEYLSFWHHPNKYCYDELDWIQDPVGDPDAGGSSDPVVGSTDPNGGVFLPGDIIVSEETTVSEDGTVRTTVTTYVNGETYTKTTTLNVDGTTTIHQIFRDGTEETVHSYTGRGGKAGFIDPNTGSPEEEREVENTGRQSWLDLVN